MRKTSFLGSNRKARDDGSILGLVVFILFFFVAASGLLLRASYSEYRLAQAEYEEFVLEHEMAGEGGER